MNTEKTEKKKRYAKPRCKTLTAQIGWDEVSDPGEAAKLKAALLDWMVRGIVLPRAEGGE